MDYLKGRSRLAGSGNVGRGGGGDNHPQNKRRRVLRRVINWLADFPPQNPPPPLPPLDLTLNRDPAPPPLFPHGGWGGGG